MNAARSRKWRLDNPERVVEQNRSYREKRAEGGLTEVRGIWAKPEFHQAIKDHVASECFGYKS